MAVDGDPVNQSEIHIHKAFNYNKSSDELKSCTEIVIVGNDFNSLQLTYNCTYCGKISTMFTFAQLHYNKSISL